MTDMVTMNTWNEPCNNYCNEIYSIIQKFGDRKQKINTSIQEDEMRN